MDLQNDLDLSVIRDKLRMRRREVEQLIEDHHGDARPVALDQTRVGRLSRMDALQGQEMAKATARRRESEVGRIEAALQRIAEGDYGYCLSCGEEIAVGRLERDPTASICIDCARAAEQPD